MNPTKLSNLTALAWYSKYCLPPCQQFEADFYFELEGEETSGMSIIEYTYRYSLPGGLFSGLCITMEIFIFVSYTMLHIQKSYLYSIPHLDKNMHKYTDTFYYANALLNINRIFVKLQINVKMTLCKHLILPTHWHILSAFKCCA